MAYFERMRDVISQPFSPEIIQQRTGAGWQMVSIEWRRELPDAEAPPDNAFSEEIPLRPAHLRGLQAPGGRTRRKPGPADHDGPTGTRLHVLGHRERSEREGIPPAQRHPWSRIAVFNMMPRLIEVGPRLFSSDEWEQRRLRMMRAREHEEV